MEQSDQTKRLVASIDSFKRSKEADEIHRWRHASREEKWLAIARLMDWAEDVMRASGRKHVPDPLPTDWLPSRDTD